MERLTFRDANGEAWYSDRGTDADRLHFITAIEDILGGDYDLDKLRTLVEADRAGRCVVLPAQYTETTGGQALEHAMRVCAVTNNAVTRYTADAIAEKVVREAEQALEEMEDAHG